MLGYYIIGNIGMRYLYSKRGAKQYNRDAKYQTIYKAVFNINSQWFGSILYNLISFGKISPDSIDFTDFYRFLWCHAKRTGFQDYLHPSIDNINCYLFRVLPFIFHIKTKNAWIANFVWLTLYTTLHWLLNITEYTMYSLLFMR